MSIRAAIGWLQRLLIGLAAGGALGWIAWGGGHAPLAAALLPFALAGAANRTQAFAVGMAYAIGVLRYAAAFIGGWFDDNVLVGAGAVIAYGVITGAVWCIGWSRSASGARRAAAMAAAWMLAGLTPATVGIPGHPLIAAGYLLPGTGWFGVAASLLLAAAAGWCVPLAIRRGATAAGSAGAVVAVTLAGAALVISPPLPQSGGAARGVQATSTSWGKLRGLDNTVSRVERMGRLSREAHATTIVWPESIIGQYEPALFPVMKLELLDASRAAGQVQVVGMDVPLHREKLLNSAVAFYPDGSTATAVARQPAPLSLWRPWSAQTFVADWTASNMLNLGQGDRAAVIFCYEEYLPALYLLNEALDRPTMYVAMTNTWAAQRSEAAAIQTWHSYGMARLFGRVYLKAENRPASAAPLARTPSFAP